MSVPVYLCSNQTRCEVELGPQCTYSISTNVNASTVYYRVPASLCSYRTPCEVYLGSMGLQYFHKRECLLPGTSMHPLCISVPAYLCSYRTPCEVDLGPMGLQYFHKRKCLLLTYIYAGVFHTFVLPNFKW